MLEIIEDKNLFKRLFAARFKEVLRKYPDFYEFMMNLLISGTAYVVGGFVRDSINNKQSRDLDMIVSLSHTDLNNLLKESDLTFSINRMLGIKIDLGGFEVDIWSIDNNWAFRDSVVKRNEDYILDNISDGCFYNYDGLVVNVHSNNFRSNHYNDFVREKKLNIIQKSKYYKVKNPTIEANLLRAIYLNTFYGVDIAPNCMSYLDKVISQIGDNYDVQDRLNIYLNKYDKYKKVLSIEDVMDTVRLIKYIHANREAKKQLNFGFGQLMED
ncbi:hypothetical protein [Pareuzebyella sediminis]|uniref:hypothetical protein n=1 Tax=Pareuzebyella sediminis TaxID=2607998 RepID=UPI0011ED41AF|nr:hypothetical protein [Pareuzebyella sediminis]